MEKREYGAEIPIRRQCQDTTVRGTRCVSVARQGVFCERHRAQRRRQAYGKERAAEMATKDRNRLARLRTWPNEALQQAKQKALRRIKDIEAIQRNKQQEKKSES